MREKWAGSEAIGFIVIVGIDRQDELNRMANEIGGEVYLDTEGDIFKELGGKGVPHWFVLNSDNKVIKNLAGIYDPLEEHIKMLGF